MAAPGPWTPDPTVGPSQPVQFAGSMKMTRAAQPPTEALSLAGGTGWEICSGIKLFLIATCRFEALFLQEISAVS